MDQLKTGEFIASLRRQHDLTQEELGNKLGVTNKTVSRWENGNYMPDVEMLQLLSKEFDVSINEILSGERLSDVDFRKQADENIVAVAKSSAFSLEEKKKYFKKKWRKEHISLFVVLALVVIAVAVLPIILGCPELCGLSFIALLVAYCYQNNKMMIYVERKIYDTAQ